MMKKYNPILLFLFLGLTLFFCQSCKTTKDTTSSLNLVKSVARMENVLDNQFSFDWINVRFMLSSDLLQGIPMSGQLRMRKDSVIWISLNTFGFYEIARIKATQDSLFVLDKHNNQYFVGDYRFLEKYTGIKTNFNMFEALLTGNDFQCFDTSNYQTKESAQKTGIIFENRRANNNCIVHLEKSQQLNQALIIDNETYKILQNTLSTANNQLQADYSVFQKSGDRLFPTEVIFSLSSSVASESRAIKISFQKPATGQVQTFPFNIPANASPMKF